VVNGMKTNPGKSNAVRFTRSLMKYPLNYSLLDHEIPETSSSKYLGITLSSNLSRMIILITRRKNLEGTSFHNAYS
jgi:hypothetical protein